MVRGISLRRLILSLATVILTCVQAVAQVTGTVSVDQDHTGHRLFNVATPTNPADVTNKSYVDSVAGGAGLPIGGFTGQVLSKNSATDFDVGWSTVSGTGTVTNFIAGDLSPLFTTSVATATTTPTLSFTLSNVGANTYLGNNTGSSAAPVYAAAAALTKTDDTNVTLTLGGNPTTALLMSTSITVGWTGTLAAARGGLGINAGSVTDGQIPIGRTSDNTFGLATITAGSGITVTNGGHTITIASTGAGTSTAALGITIDGGGATITTGSKGYFYVPYACTINSVSLLANQSGSIVIEIRKCTYAQFDAGSTHPVTGDKINSGTPPTISSSTKGTDSTLSGWTTSISAGDVLEYNVNSCTAIQRCNLVMSVTK